MNSTTSRRSKRASQWRTRRSVVYFCRRGSTLTRPIVSTCSTKTSSVRKMTNVCAFWRKISSNTSLTTAKKLRRGAIIRFLRALRRRGTLRSKKLGSVMARCQKLRSSRNQRLSSSIQHRIRCLIAATNLLTTCGRSIKQRSRTSWKSLFRGTKSTST